MYSKMIRVVRAVVKDNGVWGKCAVQLLRWIGIPIFFCLILRSARLVRFQSRQEKKNTDYVHCRNCNQIETNRSSTLCVLSNLPFTVCKTKTSNKYRSYYTVGAKTGYPLHRILCLLPNLYWFIVWEQWKQEFKYIVN